MKLYDIQRNSKIYVKCDDGSKYIVFHRLDGMYSYCKTEKGNICHLSAVANLKKYKDGYKVVE